MAKLLDWLPFRFKKNQRREGEDNAIAVRRESAPARANAAWPQVFDEMLAADPWLARPLAMLRRMEEALGAPFGEFGVTNSFFGDFSGTFSPRLDVSEDDEGLKVVAELPGVSPEDIEVEVQEGALILSGEKKHEEEHKDDGFYRIERSFGSFRRVVPLPEGLDLDKVEARHKNGVLTVRIARKGEPTSRSRRITVEG